MTRVLLIIIVILLTIPAYSQEYFNKRFEYAVDFAKEVLKAEIDKIRRRMNSENQLKEYIVQ